MDLIELPNKLYKFITWEKDYHKRLVEKNEVFFTSAAKFNDPFDSTIPLRYDYGNDEQILERYKTHIIRDNPHIDDVSLCNIAKQQMELNDVKNPANIKKNLEYQRNWALTKYGIFSVTEEYDNILLWSHYSNSHTGICIRFDSEKLKCFIEHDCVKEKLIIVCDRIDYKEKYPVLNPFLLEGEEVVLKPLLVKSDKWKYENELRFILYDYPNKQIFLPDGIIDQIILGCKISEDAQKEILKIANNKSINVLKAEIKPNSFGLVFNEINV